MGCNRINTLGLNKFYFLVNVFKITLIIRFFWAYQSSGVAIVDLQALTFSVWLLALVLRQWLEDYLIGLDFPV